MRTRTRPLTSPAVKVCALIQNGWYKHILATQHYPPITDILTDTTDACTELADRMVYVLQNKQILNIHTQDF